MKSLLVTAVVLSTFALPGFAEQPDQKVKEQVPGRGRRHGGVAATKRPDIKVQPAQSPKREGVQQLPQLRQQKPQSLGKKLQPVPQVKPAPQPPQSKATLGTKAQVPIAQQVPPKGHIPFEQPTHAAPPAAHQVPPQRVAQKPVAGPRSLPVRHQQNPHMHNFVQARTLAYRKTYNTQLLALQKRYLAPTYLAPLRMAYRPWVKVGFRAYAYPVRPVVEFYTYFSNPCVAWFYNEYDAEFYQPFYGRYVARYPELGRGYNHVGIYLPTEEFMAMNVALSDLPIEMQVNYRRAMVFLGDRLAERYRAPIARHQVIVNHYAMLPSNRAVVIEGFVDNESTQMPFKALVDLNNADNSELFAVSAWKSEETPTVEQSQELYDLNDQIVDLGGSVDTSEPQS